MVTPVWLDDLDPGDLDAAVQRIEQAVDEGHRVVVAAHVSPDGDSLGGILALHLGLERRGLVSIPTVGDVPLKVPAALAELPGVGDLVPPSALPEVADVDLVMTADVASLERLGRVASYIENGVTSILLDHHASAGEFGDVRLVAPRAAATVQIVDELLRRLGVPLDAQIATCLYAGLVTDTARFGHPNTDRSTMEFAGRLIEAGAPHAELTRRLYDTRSIGELRLLSQALDRLTFLPDVALAHTHVTHQELNAMGLGLEAVEAVIDVVRSVDLAEVALVVKPAPDGTWRASLRSRGKVDVGALATRLGGGGHHSSAGFSDDRPVERIVDDVVAILREA